MFIYSFIILWFLYGVVYDDNYVYIYFLYIKKGGGGRFDVYGIYIYFVNELEMRFLNVVQSLLVLCFFYMVLY